MKIAVLGAGGRMGQALTRAVAETPGCTVAGGVEQPGSEFIGKDIGEVAGLEPLGVTITDNPVPLFAEVQAVLDFTSPKATVEFAALSAQARIVHVIGTTGLSDEDVDALKAASRHATIIRAGNMSMGVNLLANLTEKVAKALDESFDIEIVELHHRHKKDAPSGTALMLGEAAAKARGVSLKEKGVFAREGQTGERGEGDIGFSCMRGGDVVGEHKIVFVGPGERIELGHIATDRGIFSRGAVKAALWGFGKPPGLYSMADVLGL
ncbi:4-hydroxy-tetrahydrodipicolinate reductase [Methyloligella halotolerans]|uniref:4-hydroxy-tetrahydrodipicolinate reductase n=1 Tax=Methyloligella halotolerans TaxID=1177755 RepID=A0A1E2S0M9_9HYPH|nr:4-hydroxy-tetrahydrodipicolinate reductase [Methyloligella halotolerans]ODA68063.1 4-hydroxy-tetrahydrodipicolinate reductase [Methyloligella halotolerans]